MIKKIADVFCLLLLKFIFLVLGLLPAKAAEVFAYYLVRSFLIFMPRHRYVAFRNMDIVLPGMTSREKAKLLKENYMVMARNLIGLTRGNKLDKETVEKTLDVSDALEAIIESRKERDVGMLILTPHLGSFELLALYWSIYDKPVSILARGFGLPMVDAWWNKMRSVHGNTVFSRKGGYNSIISQLKKGENVAILFDQNVKPNHAAYVPFFGTLAATTKSTAIASIRTNCPIVLTAMIETKPSHYKLYAYPIKKPNDREGSQEEIIYETIKEAHQHLESIIQRHPEQWFWIHRRFKTRPKGEPETIYNSTLHPA